MKVLGVSPPPLVPGAAVIPTLRVRGRGFNYHPKKPGESYDCNNYPSLRGGDE